MKKAQYQVLENGDFSLKQYRLARPFSSFFPGIAGLNGIPLWVFYTNRGQCISSFGIDNKDHAMLEFFPANRSYQLTPLLGFRTFLKLHINGQVKYWEPFRDNEQACTSHEMIFSSEKLTLTETHSELPLSIKINYFTVPEESFAGLVREVELSYQGQDTVVAEIIDGLPWVNAYGTNLWVQKNMSRTGEAWVQVKHFKNMTPLFKLKVVIQDKPEVDEITSGHFAVYTCKHQLLPIIIDPEKVFGSQTDLEFPRAFMDADKFKLPEHQTHENFTPCAFSYQKITLLPQSQHHFEGLFGHVFHEKDLPRCVSRTEQKGWFQEKKITNARLMMDLQNPGQIFSANPVFDQYAKSTYLDNLLRGGTPVTFTDDLGKPHVLHVYSRKHGDLERDYNHFSIQPNFFSQGNGNYRDVNQNRRCDLYFNPFVKEQNIKVFLNLLQLDGHNPLVLKGSRFSVPETESESIVKKYISSKPNQLAIKEKIQQSFTPGELAAFMEQNSIMVKSGTFADFFSSLLTHAIREEISDLVEGFWSDHWTYNLDLIENYLSIYPENFQKILFDDKEYNYFKSPAYINPRSKRYILRNGKPFQTNNITEHHEEKSSLVRTRHGKGKIYNTSLMAKLVCLATNKLATLDPSGIGIEMEGGRPNWYDALNGLPGIFGSSTHETFELKRLIVFIQKAATRFPERKLMIHKELAVFLTQLSKLLTDQVKSGFKNAFLYWDKSNTIKEQYRLQTMHGIAGEDVEYSSASLKKLLDMALLKVNHGLKQCLHPKHKLPISYYYQEMTSYNTKVIKGETVLIPKSFKAFALPLFLEGTVHGLKTESEKAKDFSQQVRKSNLYDSKLNMFKVCESLESMPKAIGRCTVFSRGWLENESIWLHMEYKYLLELLKNGLHEEFFESIKTSLVPFMNPEIYGRSILENSSFIASSANPDPGTHGRGFVARLSGSTIELLHMLNLMQLGPKPFDLDEENRLVFSPKPLLPGNFFNPESKVAEWLYLGEKQIKTLPSHHFAFVLFNSTLICYENKLQLNTFDDQLAPISYKIEYHDGSLHTVESAVLPEMHAVKLRNQKIKSIEIQLGKTYSTKNIK